MAEHKRENDFIFRNSFTLIISSLVAAGFGFIFWIVAARYYSAEDVGIATSAISAIGIITLLARFGIDQSMMKDMPQGDKGRIVTTTIALVTVSTIVFSFFFLSTLHVWAPDLKDMADKPWIFIAVAISNCLFIVLGNAYLALRLPRVHLYQNILGGIRLLLLPLLIGGGAIGILLSMGVGYAIPMIILPMLAHSRIGIKQIDIGWARHTISNSLSFYINNILTQIPALILPLLVLGILGPEATAHYYMSYTIASIIFMIPVAVGTTLFVEISHGEDIMGSLHRAIKTTYIVQIPAIVAVIFFGSAALSLIGQDYAENGTGLLLILAISSIITGLVTLYFSMLRGVGLNRPLVLVGFALFFLLIGLSAVFILWFGLIGVGLAWIVGHACVLPFMLIHWYRFNKDNGVGNPWQSL